MLLLKGYLRYKTIISRDVSSEAQKQNFFISYKSYVPFSRYLSFCIFNYPMIYQICDVIMSISAWDRIDISKGNIFMKSSDRFGGLGMNSRPFSILQPGLITW